MIAREGRACTGVLTSLVKACAGGALITLETEQPHPSASSQRIRES